MPTSFDGYSLPGVVDEMKFGMREKTRTWTERVPFKMGVITGLTKFEVSSSRGGLGGPRGLGGEVGSKAPT